jgi:hypothetical protein
MSALVEARESLSYWEHRLQTLPRFAVRQRREAREMAARWRDRVSQAELAEYGPGLIGTIFMLLAERRVPSRTRHSARQVVRVTVGVAVGLAVSLTLVAVAIFALLLALIF